MRCALLHGCLGLSLGVLGCLSVAVAEEWRPADASPRPSAAAVTLAAPVRSAAPDRAVGLGAPSNPNRPAGTAGSDIVQASYSAPATPSVALAKPIVRAQNDDPLTPYGGAGIPAWGVPAEAGFGMPAADPGPVAGSWDDCGGGCYDFTWFAGGGVYWLQPHFENNPAFTTSQLSLNNGNRLTVARQQDFNWEYESGARAWIGYMGEEGRGGRIRWWRFENGTNLIAGNPDGVDPLTGAGVTITDATGFVLSSRPGDVLTFESELKLDVADLEAMKEFRLGNWSALGSAGVRYAQLRQGYVATLDSPNPLRTPAGAIARFGHDFDGFGPTLAIELRRPIGCGLTLYGSARTSLLFGDSKQSFTGVQRFTPAGEVATQFFSQRNEVLPVGEIELGLEYSVDCGCCLLVFQGAYVGQIWYGAGSASSQSGNLGFTGMTLTAGIHF